MAPIIRQLWYITHLSNLESILTHGILSREQVKKRKIEFLDISEQEVQQRRQSYHDYVPLFFADNTPMLYVVCKEYGIGNICLLAIHANILNKIGVLFCDGNLAADETKIHKSIDGIPDDYWQIIYSRRPAWGTDWKRIRSAEVLIPQEVPVEYFKAISVSSVAKMRVPLIQAQDICNIPIYANLTPNGLQSEVK